MNVINNLGIMVDCSRDAVYTVDTMKKYIDLMAKMGYNILQLYTEDTYSIDEPYFGYLRGKYSEAELLEIDDYAHERGIEVIPCIQTLAHLAGFLRWKPEITDTGYIMLAGEEKTYELIDKMFAACAKCFRSRRVNIGMDEADSLGLGQYLWKNGYTKQSEIMLKHLKRVLEIAKKYGFTPMMWSDMFFRIANGSYYVEEGNEELPREVLDIVPREVELAYWDYWTTEQETYDRQLKAHKRFKNKILFAGGATSWTGFVPKNESSLLVTEAAIKACQNNGIDEFLLTCWKDDGAECSLFASLPVLYATAQMAKGNFDRGAWIKGFEKEFDLRWEDFMLLDAPDRLDEDAKWSCPSKYMLYSDPFLGIFDDTVDLAHTGKYAAWEEDFAKRAENAKEYGYIFRTMSALCGVLKNKYAIGVRTRACYQAGDRAGLAALLVDYEELLVATEGLRDAFETQWKKEAKFYGFEKHELRLGGLMQRVKTCKKRLQSYVNGEMDRIEELEEKILPFTSDQPHGKTLCYNNWINTAMIKPHM